MTGAFFCALKKNSCKKFAGMKKCCNFAPALAKNNQKDKNTQKQSQSVLQKEKECQWNWEVRGRKSLQLGWLCTAKKMLLWWLRLKLIFSVDRIIAPFCEGVTGGRSLKFCYNTELSSYDTLRYETLTLRNGLRPTKTSWPYNLITWKHMNKPF